MYKPMNWNQPICERCWIDRQTEAVWKPSYTILSYANMKLPVVIQREETKIERCSYCGKPTFLGAYIRDNPEKVPYPREEET